MFTESLRRPWSRTRHASERARRGARAEPIFDATSLLPGASVSILITITVCLTMTGAPRDLLTLALHYPVFLLIALVAVQALPRRWRTVVSLVTIPLVLLEVAVLLLPAVVRA